MLDAQDDGAGTPAATADAGAAAGSTQKTENFTAADMQREADRRVSEAQKRWKADLDTAIADKTKDAETKLTEAAARAEQAETYANFVEAATTAGIRNVKAAYKVAQGEYFTTKGDLDVARFKKDNPEFFAPAPNGNAGNGAGAPTNNGGMNAFIRAAAGRG